MEKSEKQAGGWAHAARPLLDRKQIMNPAYLTFYHQPGQLPVNNLFASASPEWQSPLQPPAGSLV